MNIKKRMLGLLILVMTTIFSPVSLEAADVNAQPVAMSDCVETQISIDKDSVYSSGQVKVTFKYYSLQPACSADQIVGQRIVIDLSDVLDTPLSTAIQSPLEETDHYVPSIEGDNLVLTFKDISALLDEGEGLEDFWGSFSFVIQVKSVTDDTNSSISDNVSGSADIDILAPSTGSGSGGIENTQKWPEKDYVSQGDYLKYTIRLNNDWEYHDSIHMEDTIPRGMSLVIDDPEHPIDIYQSKSPSDPWPNTDLGDISDRFNITATPSKLTVDSTSAIDYGINIHYWVHVDSEVSSGEYNNMVRAVYDDQVENTDYTVELNGGSDTGEEGAGSYIELSKQDQFGNPVAGAEFSVSDGTKTVATLVTDADGYAISDKLPCGEYMVRETKAPEDYDLNPNKFFVTLEIDEEVVAINEGNPVIDNVSMGQIKLLKTDDRDNPLSGAEFTIYDSTGTEVDVITSDSSGVAQSTDLKLGDYTVVETKAPTGYVLDTTEYSVTLVNPGEVVTINQGNPIVNHLETGNIEITKVDQDGHVLSGAEFDIIDQAGDVVDHVVTDGSGIATSINLPLGSYTVIETEAPDGYTLDQTPHQIEIESYQQVVQITIENVLTQTPDISLPQFTRKGNIEITKVDQDGNSLSGAEFDIVDESGEVVDHLITGVDGVVKSIDLKLGDYTIIETKAPDGYTLDQTPHQVTIESNNQLVQITIENVLTQTPDITLPTVERTGQIEIIKVNPDNQRLAAAEFDIIDQAGTVVDHLVTNEQGTATSIQLPLGDYTVVETKAPDMYQLDPTPHQVQIENNAQVVGLTVTNQPIEIEIGGGKDIEDPTVTDEPENQSKITITTVGASSETSSEEPASSSNSLMTTGSKQVIIVINLLLIIAVSLILKTKFN